MNCLNGLRVYMGVCYNRIAVVLLFYRGRGRGMEEGRNFAFIVAIVHCV